MPTEQETKIYCCDHDRNDGLLAAALAGDRNRGMENPMAMAAMMNGGMGNQWNNPLIYLVWMMFAQRMLGNGWNNGPDGNGGCCCNNPQIAALQNEMQDNHNADLIMQGINGNANAIAQFAQKANCDFNTLNSCCCDLRQNIASLAGQVGLTSEKVINAVINGDCNVIQALKDCCCQTQRQLADFRADVQLQNCNNTSTLRNGQRDLGVAISQGFSQVGFQAQQDKCDILQAITAAQQKTTDQLNAHWQSETERRLQKAEFENSQLRQSILFDQKMDQRFGRGGCGCGCRRNRDCEGCDGCGC